MSKKDSILPFLASIVCLINLEFSQWKYAAISGFIAVMLMLMGIEEQL
jgi:hypothetical protein